MIYKHDNNYLSRRTLLDICRAEALCLLNSNSLCQPSGVHLSASTQSVF